MHLLTHIISVVKVRVYYLCLTKKTLILCNVNDKLPVALIRHYHLTIMLQ